MIVEVLLKSSVKELKTNVNGGNEGEARNFQVNVEAIASVYMYIIFYFICANSFVMLEKSQYVSTQQCASQRWKMHAVKHDYGRRGEGAGVKGCNCIEAYSIAHEGYEIRKS